MPSQEAQENCEASSSWWNLGLEGQVSRSVDVRRSASVPSSSHQIQLKFEHFGFFLRVLPNSNSAYVAPLKKHEMPHVDGGFKETL